MPRLLCPTTSRNTFKTWCPPSSSSEEITSNMRSSPMTHDAPARRQILARREKCSAVDQSGHAHSRSQEAHFPKHCQCFDAKTVTPTFVSTPAIPEFPCIQRGVDLQFQQSHVAVDTTSRNLGISTIAPAPNVVLSSHQQGLLPLQREAAEMRWLSEDSRLLPELVDQQIVSQKQ